MVRRGGHPEFNMEGAKGSAVSIGHNLPKTGKSQGSVVHRQPECGKNSTLWKQEASSPERSVGYFYNLCEPPYSIRTRVDPQRGKMSLQITLVRKLVDYDDWMLNPKVFKKLDSRWGPHTIDRFADV